MALRPRKKSGPTILPLKVNALAIRPMMGEMFGAECMSVKHFLVHYFKGYDNPVSVKSIYDPSDPGTEYGIGFSTLDDLVYFLKNMLYRDRFITVVPATMTRQIVELFIDEDPDSYKFFTFEYEQIVVVSDNKDLLLKLKIMA